MFCGTPLNSLEGAAMLAKRCLGLASYLIAQDEAPTSIQRGGRKAHSLHMDGLEQGRKGGQQSLMAPNGPQAMSALPSLTG